MKKCCRALAAVSTVNAGMNLPQKLMVSTETRPSPKAKLTYVNPNVVTSFRENPELLKKLMCGRMLNMFQWSKVEGCTAAQQDAEVAKCVQSLMTEDLEGSIEDLLMAELKGQHLPGNIVLSQHEVKMHNARTLTDDTAPTLNSMGFTLVQSCNSIHPSPTSSAFPSLDWLTWAETLVQEITGAENTFAFMHSVRKRAAGSNDIANYVHCDFTSHFGKDLTTWLAHGGMISHETEYSDVYFSLKQRLLDAGVTIEKLSNCRIMVVNVWCGLDLGSTPICNFPMAFCDQRTVMDKDILDNIKLAGFSSNHRWYYYPELATDEVLVFLTFDSHCAALGHKWPGILHTSFDNPDATATSLVQKSFDVKVLCLLHPPPLCNVGRDAAKT